MVVIALWLAGCELGVLQAEILGGINSGLLQITWEEDLTDPSWVSTRKTNFSEPDWDPAWAHWSGKLRSKHVIQRGHYADSSLCHTRLQAINQPGPREEQSSAIRVTLTSFVLCRCLLTLSSKVLVCC